jgi:hypothetical protein
LNLSATHSVWGGEATVNAATTHFAPTLWASVTYLVFLLIVMASASSDVRHLNVPSFRLRTLAERNILEIVVEDDTILILRRSTRLQHSKRKEPDSMNPSGSSLRKRRLYHPSELRRFIERVKVEELKQEARTLESEMPRFDEQPEELE